MYDISVCVVVTCVSPRVMIVCETMLKKCFEPKLNNICTLQAILSHQTHATINFTGLVHVPR